MRKEKIKNTKRRQERKRENDNKVKRRDKQRW